MMCSLDGFRVRFCELHEFIESLYMIGIVTIMSTLQLIVVLA